MMGLRSAARSVAMGDRLDRPATARHPGSAGSLASRASSRAFAAASAALVTLLEVLPEQSPALEEGKPAQILVADLQEVEGVKARCTGPRAA